MQYVKNEWIKIWSQKNAWIMLGISFALIILFVGISKYFDEPGKTKEDRAKDNTALIEQNKSSLAETNDEEGKQYYQDEIQMLEYRIANDLPSPDKVTFTEQMKNLISIISVLVSIFGVVIAAGIVSSEFSTGTIKMLLTRPVARWKILLSKLIASILYSLTVLLASVALSAILSAILFGTDATVELYIVDGQVIEETMKIIASKDIALMLGSLFMTIIFAFMIGSLFGSSTLAVSISLLILLMGSTVVMFLAKYSFTKFIWFAHDLSIYEDGGTSMLENVTLNDSIVVNIIYLIIFLAITFITFVKRDVTA